MTVKVANLRAGDLIKAGFLNDDKWHKVLVVNHQANGVYLAVEGYRGEIFPKDYEVEVKD